MTPFEKQLRLGKSDFLGQLGEAIFESIFRVSDVRYIPLAKLDFKGAPRLDGNGQRTVLPDFDCAGDGWHGYLDSKCKSGPVYYRVERQWRHGIDRKNYESYERTGVLFGKPSGVGIIELFNDESTQAKWSGAILIETFRGLGKPFYGTSTQEHMVYWLQKQFKVLDHYSIEEIEAAANGRPPRRYEFELKDVFVPQKQKALFG